MGAYNAQVLYGIHRHPSLDGETFEERLLGKLGLKPGPISSQVLPPEPLADYLWACLKISATLGKLGRDSRHLMRSEIGEIAEEFVSTQVGSSTMAHKRNPVTFEQLEGMWLRTKAEFGKVLDTMITDHQRDLVGSSVARDFPIIVVNLTLQLDALLRESGGRTFLERIVVDHDQCLSNLTRSIEATYAEPAYIGLILGGFDGDAHEVMNRQVVPMIANGATMREALNELAKSGSPELRGAIQGMPLAAHEFFGAAPYRDYLGDATGAALRIADDAENYASTL